jgi:hypothetical protein
MKKKRVVGERKESKKRIRIRRKVWWRRKGKERKGKERKGKERKGKERKGKEGKGKKENKS